MGGGPHHADEISFCEESYDWDYGMDRDYNWDDHGWDYDAGDYGMDGYDAGC